MYKILHMADLHYGKNKKHNSETIDAVNQAAEIGSKEGVKLSVIAGDLFDENMPVDADGVDAAIRSVRMLAEIAPVILLRGTPTHDGDSTKIFDAHIKTKHTVRVVQDPSIIDDNEVLFFCLPGSRKRMYASLCEKYGLNMGSVTTIDLAKLQISEWAQERKRRGDSVSPVLIAHAQIDGDAFPPVMESGYEPMIPTELIDSVIGRRGIAIMGHIHRGGKYGDGGRYIYAGGLTAMDMSDAVEIDIRGTKADNLDIQGILNLQQKGFYIHTKDNHQWKSRFYSVKSRKFLKIICDLRKEESEAMVDKIANIIEKCPLPITMCLHILNVSGKKVAERVYNLDERLRDMVKSRFEERDIEVMPPKIKAVLSEQTSRVSSESEWREFSLERKFFQWAKMKGVDIADEDEKWYIDAIRRL